MILCYRIDTGHDACGLMRLHALTDAYSAVTCKCCLAAIELMLL